MMWPSSWPSTLISPAGVLPSVPTWTVSTPADPAQFGYGALADGPEVVWTTVKRMALLLLVQAAPSALATWMKLTLARASHSRAALSIAAITRGIAAPKLLLTQYRRSSLALSLHLLSAPLTCWTISALSSGLRLCQ